MSDDGQPPQVEEMEVHDGLRIGVRPIRSGDKELLASAFEQLSPESRYRRFFAPLRRLSPQDLRYLTEVDHHDHEALIAVDPESGNLVGVARYVKAEDPAEAEVAVVIGDPWQKKGIASALLERLVGRAREEGIDHFIALVLHDNTDALDLFENVAPGGSTTRRSASGHVEMLIELPEEGELEGSWLARVLRTVARDALSVNPWRFFRQAIRRRPTEEMMLPREGSGDAAPRPGDEA